MLRDGVGLQLKQHSVLPGFGLTMGYTVTYVSLLVIIPLAGLFFSSARVPWEEAKELLMDSDLHASLKLTFGAAFTAACINLVFGFIVAWTLVRYPFPGSRFVDGLVDLPFALPTAVSGITLVTLFNTNGWYGAPWLVIATKLNWVIENVGISALLKWVNYSIPWLGLPEAVPVQIGYTKWGVFVALTFISLPFIVRSLQPALEDLDPEVEEAAASLGASRLQTFMRVVLPSLGPALLTGFTLALARAIGEYGSVIFISNNIPGQSEITAHMIMKKLEDSRYAEATLIGLVMLVASFVLLATINGIQWWAGRKSRG